ncbi:MAG: DEAD/DEAH box helicase, partial [Treponema sp.]|nr:DEAD/DEAH box helicase [Treponema sp.]
MDDFTSLGVLPVFAENLKKRGIGSPTAIQRLAIPPLLAGKSMAFRSATGTGKTFAYLIPALQRMLGDIESAAAFRYGGPWVLVCAPTFELCSQIKEEVDFLLTPALAAYRLAANHAPSSLLIGSVSLNRQIESLKKNKALTVVGNPGRLLMLAKMGKLKLRGLRFLVLDEADRMTAAESLEETAALLGFIARGSGSEEGGLQAAACSATIAGGTRDALAGMLPIFRNAETLASDEWGILQERIEHWAIFSEGRRKTQTLRSFLEAAKPKKALVFAGRTDQAGKLAAALQYHHVSAAGLYSGMEKKERKQAADGFRSGKITTLVSSDLAARGLDFPGISHVIALDVPEDADVYIHRAGRTARAGKHGIMVSIGNEAEMRRLAVLEKKLNIIVQPKDLYRGRVC